ncbi:hypothetical protein PPUJ20005_46380 [Pseudomonas putida]|nr:hypothetical protein PPUJ20005_46380 [Pseudomonas putida]
MRFYSADSWSPFGKGGINAYGYGAGDPVNGTDPTGHMFNRLRLFWKMIKYHDAVAAGNAEKIFLREGKHLIPPSEINLRQELDRHVVSAQNNLIDHRRTLNTLPDVPQNAAQRDFAKKRIVINQALLNDAVRRDLTVQKQFIVEPSTRYTFTVGKNGDIAVEIREPR